MSSNRRIFAKVGAVAGALAMMGAMPVTSVFAAEGTTYAPVAGGTAVFEKYLTMNSQSEVPNATFKFAIDGGVTALDSDGASTLHVYAGNDANNVVGAPTISDAVFAQGDTTYDSIQDQPTSVTVRNQDDGKTTNKDLLTLDSGKKYARHDVTVDFTGVQYKEPGVYRYLITEQATTNQGVTNDADTTRIMDVYVNDDNGTLKIGGYVLQNAEPDGTVKRDGTGTTEKSKGYTNDYTTHDLTISKTVTGNQASHDEYFKMTVKLSNAVAGTVYDVDLSNADATTKTGGFNTEAHTNPATLTVGADGTVTQDFWIQNGQSIKIQGLADKTAYSINEDADLMDKEGYDPAAKVTGDTKTGEADTAKDIVMDASTYTVTDDAITADTTVAYTNVKEGNTPTGVAMAVAPFATAGIAGVVGAGAIIVSKRKKKEDED
ncbi:MAG: QVPTGV class sortase B protein-sorting domain-containing protein [Lactimicrobium massiliense]|nr:QVPTGV class sortase B protein-sorting domain-containing protein [Lactimicrobium massiliense]MDD6560777.1 QVPTGV class sortase B protein-sorting domain-containing protein [Lactimicrobium massiliense]